MITQASGHFLHAPKGTDVIPGIDVGLYELTPDTRDCCAFDFDFVQGVGHTPILFATTFAAIMSVVSSQPTCRSLMSGMLVRRRMLMVLPVLVHPVVQGTMGRF